MATTENWTILFNELRRAEAFLERVPLGGQRSRSWAGARERRALKRQPAGGGGTLFWTDPFGRYGASAVVARNVSENGIQLEAREKVPIPAAVHLFGQTLECLGSACYCSQAGEKYLVGINLIGEPYPKRRACTSRGQANVPLDELEVRI